MKIKLLVAIFIIIISYSVYAADYYVQKPAIASSIESACQQAYDDVSSGPHNVIVPDGIYHDLGAVIVTSEKDAQVGKEITIKPETPGGVTLKGNSRFVINGEYWIISGFVWDSFDSGFFQRCIHVDAANVRVTDCEFRNSGGIGDKPQAIRICSVITSKCANNAINAEIDHNFFHDWAGQGIIAYTDVVSPHIHHNYFKDFPQESDDDCTPVGFAGTEGNNDYPMHGIVEHNVFENCAGDFETIMFKTSDNIARYNVFFNLGSTNPTFGASGVSLRLGEDNLVYNNWFFRNDNSNMQGLSISDRGHKIVNNYFYGLGGPARSVSFAPADSLRDNAEDILVESNTFYDTKSSRLLQFGQSGTSRPIVIRNNIFHSAGNYIARDLTNGDCNVLWANNLAYTTGTYYTGTGCGGSWPSDSSGLNQLTSGEFSALWTTRTTEYGPIYVLDSANVAIGKGHYDSNYPKDFDSQARSNPPDIGADEYSTSPVLIEPISRNEVGPTWMMADPPQKCSDIGGVDCCSGVEICNGTSLGTTSDCSGICCTQTCLVKIPSSGFHEYIEAESGTINQPLQNNVDQNASGGRYIFAPTGTGNTNQPSEEASLQVDIPSVGEYYLWARIFALGRDNDAFYLGFNGNFAREYSPAWGDYGWTPIQTSSGSGDYSHDISAGQNEIVFSHAEEQVRFDVVLVTNDPGFIPSGIPDIVPVSQCDASDSDNDGVVDIDELIIYINQWKTGSVSISEIMETIGKWKSGC